MKSRTRRLGLLALVPAAAGAALWLLGKPDAVAARLDTVRAPVAADLAACATPAFRILVLGQSNAANHGPAPPAGAARIPVLSGGRCYLSAAPLPGATGEGDSIWPRMAAELRHQLDGRPLAFAVLAVENTAIADWTGDGALRRRLEHDLAGLKGAGMAVDLVLWQQGEADARDGTSRAQYTAGMLALRRILDRQGVAAPLLAARSTYCPGSYGGAVRAGLQDAAAASPGILVGPDTDQLTGELRVGCHFSSAGLDAAARQWAGAVRALAQAGTS